MLRSDNPRTTARQALIYLRHQFNIDMNEHQGCLAIRASHLVSRAQYRPCLGLMMRTGCRHLRGFRPRSGGISWAPRSSFDRRKACRQADRHEVAAVRSDSSKEYLDTWLSDYLTT